jgi:hypothetical protein
MSQQDSKISVVTIESLCIIIETNIFEEKGDEEAA